MGVIEFGRLYWVQSELQYAAEAAARYVTINPNADVSAVQSYAAAQVSGVSIPTGDFTVTPYSSGSNPPTPSCGNQVTVRYQFQFIIQNLMPYGPIALRTPPVATTADLKGPRKPVKPRLSRRGRG